MTLEADDRHFLAVDISENNAIALDLDSSLQRAAGSIPCTLATRSIERATSAFNMRLLLIVGYG